MADKYIATAEDLTALANSIRVKAEVTGSLVFPTGFISAISELIKSDVVCKSGIYQPTEDSRNITIPTGITDGTPLIYVLCAPEVTGGPSATYAVALINHLEIFGQPFSLLTSTQASRSLYGEYYLRIEQSATTRALIISEADLNTYFSSTEIKPPASPPHLFSKDLIYSWFAIYSA